MRTAGVAYDFYDERGGETLRKVFPTAESLPSIIKEAHILSSQERDVLRDEAFALVMLNDGKPLRKFACVDAGNTALSVIYFLEKQAQLPEKAQKTAAAHLVDACVEFDLAPPEQLLKLAEEWGECSTCGNDCKPGSKCSTCGSMSKVSASGMGRKRDPKKDSAYVGDEQDWAQRTNLNAAISGGADAGRVIPTANTMKTAGKLGADESAGALTTDKRSINTKAKEPDTQYKKKTPEASAPSGPTPATAPEVNAPRTKMSRVVDVSGMEPTFQFKRKTASFLALGKYPLDTMADVQAAVGYFNESWPEMPPQDRHEFCKLAEARAYELGLQTSDLMKRYGGTGYADDVDAHLANRAAMAPDLAPVWEQLREKRSSIDPEGFVRLLGEADESAGLNWSYGGPVQDNYYAVFGGGSALEKQAADNSNWYWQGLAGDYVNSETLWNLAQNGRPLVHKHFESELTNAFCANPTVIFDSLPEDKKKILSRLANDLNRDGLPGGN